MHITQEALGSHPVQAEHLVSCTGWGVPEPPKWQLRYSFHAALYNTNSVKNINKVNIL